MTVKEVKELIKKITGHEVTVLKPHGTGGRVFFMHKDVTYADFMHKDVTYADPRRDAYQALQLLLMKKDPIVLERFTMGDPIEFCTECLEELTDV